MENNSKISYEPEADILRVEVSDKPIDYAREIGNFVVHFSPEGLPVYVEILQASKFRQVAEKAFEKPAVSLPLGI
jgi:uncharacterized protein YuzE